MVAWPRLNPRRFDAVERVAEDYLKALAREDAEAARRLATIDEPPAIRSVRSVARERGGDRLLKGSFAPVGEFHSRITAEYDYDAGSGRFTPKNPLGAAAETMDLLEGAKKDAESSGLYKKMQSGDPDDLFDAAEQFGKVFTKLAEGVLAPKRILPSYQMLVESAKPPLPEDAKALALEVAGSPKQWDALLKRPFQSLKADGPVHLRAGRGDRDGHGPSGVARRPARAAQAHAGSLPPRGDRHGLESRLGAADPAGRQEERSWALSVNSISSGRSEITAAATTAALAA